MGPILDRKLCDPASLVEVKEVTALSTRPPGSASLGCVVAVSVFGRDSCWTATG